MDEQWKTTKCNILCEDSLGAGKEMTLNGQQLSKSNTAPYLSVAISAKGVAAETSTTRIQNAGQRLKTIIKARRPKNHIQHSTVVTICKGLVYPKSHIRTTFNSIVDGAAGGME